MVSCSVGPGRMRAHRAVQHALCRELRRIGAEVDLERVVPELCGRPQSGRTSAAAVMDLWVACPGTAERYLMDVTIRAPHASRYPDAHIKVGTDAAAGAKEKLDLHGPSVLAVPFETYGRLGDVGVESLHRVALAANSRTAWGGCHSRLYHTLRSAAERALHYATADVALLSLGAATEGALRGL